MRIEGFDMNLGFTYEIRKLKIIVEPTIFYCTHLKPLS